MSLGPSFVQFKKTHHQLERRDMGEHAKDVIFALFDGVDEDDL